MIGRTVCFFNGRFAEGGITIALHDFSVKIDQFSNGAQVVASITKNLIASERPAVVKVSQHGNRMVDCWGMKIISEDFTITIGFKKNVITVINITADPRLG